MELISKMLFWVANSLLIPDVIILLLLFARALILIGGTYNMYIAKRKNDRAFDALVKEGRTDELRQSLPANDNSLYVCYLRDLVSEPDLIETDYPSEFVDLPRSRAEIHALQDRAIEGNRSVKADKAKKNRRK